MADNTKLEDLKNQIITKIKNNEVSAEEAHELLSSVTQSILACGYGCGGGC